MSEQVSNFAAIDRVLQVNIPKPVEVAERKEWVLWGEDNRYPAYELELYKNCSTLKSIIDGSIDFTVGNDVVLSSELSQGAVGGKLNRSGETVRDIVGKMAFDWWLHRAMALQVIRAVDGSVAELYHCPLRFLRWNKERNVFFYSEDWDKERVYRVKVLTYPSFFTDKQAGSSILLYTPTIWQVYPAPIFAAAVKACEIERSIDEYHLNEINNGFASSVMINFNNGVPDDESKGQIERDIQEKFAGKHNAGRILLQWNDSLSNRATVDQFSVQDFGAKYESLSKHSMQQIFTAFRATPNLFGIPTETTGFNEQEYNEAFKLYNRTQIRPAQDAVVDMFDKVYGIKGSIQIIPFTLDGTKTIVR